MADREKDKSPWLGKPEVEAVDLPEEVYTAKIEDDEVKIARAIANARLIETPVPPESQWKRCWSCGKLVPMRVRDVLDGTLVCHQCLWTSVQQELYTSLQALVAGFAGSLGVDEDDDEDEDDGDEGIVAEGSENELGTPEVPQGNTPHIIENDGGPPAQDADQAKDTE